MKLAIGGAQFVTSNVERQQNAKHVPKTKVDSQLSMIQSTRTSTKINNLEFVTDPVSSFALVLCFLRSFPEQRTCSQAKL